MGKWFFRKHTKEIEFRQCGGHATLMLMEHVSLQIYTYLHSNSKSYTQIYPRMT